MNRPPNAARAALTTRWQRRSPLVTHKAERPETAPGFTASWRILAHPVVSVFVNLP